jgi:hypothetical protein
VVDAGLDPDKAVSEFSLNGPDVIRYMYEDANPVDSDEHHDSYRAEDYYSKFDDNHYVSVIEDICDVLSNLTDEDAGLIDM